MLKSGHHVLCTQHRYDLSAGGCSDYTTQTKHKRSFIKIWLHILWQAAAESSHPDNKGRLTKTLHKPSSLSLSLSMHSSTTGSSYHLNTHTHTLTWVAPQPCLRCDGSENQWKARGFAGEQRTKTEKIDAYKTTVKRASNYISIYYCQEKSCSNN